MNCEPTIAVGVMDRQTTVSFRLEGSFHENGFGPVTGDFSAGVTAGLILLTHNRLGEIARSRHIRLQGAAGSRFQLFKVTIGHSFHWERKVDQVFEGDLVLRLRDDGTIAVINEIALEDYLQSVISSEMNGAAPMEFLKTHAILSRSWLLAALERKGSGAAKLLAGSGESAEEEMVIRWYDREDHDLFDVCADDHCQRYQGITKIVSGGANEAVCETRGTVITYGGEICDARYSKACGGLTEDFATAWQETPVPYLVSITDAPTLHGPIGTEREAEWWIASNPDAYCNTTDKDLLALILPDFDLDTENFFRWTVKYKRTELEKILREKSGFDFGNLKEITPLQRGPSGRISRIRIVGSKKSVIVGKELEIRRWLSPTHLYSSAFTVTEEQDAHGEPERFIFHGAGWGHGVGLCQIGAAVMATKGFSTGAILGHYFPGTELRRLY